MQHIWLCLGIIFTVLGLYSLFTEHYRAISPPVTTNDTETQIKSEVKSDTQIGVDKLPAKTTSQNKPATIILRPNSRDRVVITIPPGGAVRQNFILDSRTNTKRRLITKRNHEEHEEPEVKEY